MNREIKFRGKQKTWIYGGFFKRDDGTCIIINDEGEFEVDPKSIGQFTELEDKEGKEIYEGDIVRSEMQPTKDALMTETCIMEFNPNSGYSPKHGMAFDNTWIDHFIIGNIYDNPELI